MLDGIVEFGIITAPSGVDLPVQVYDMAQLQNTDGGLTVSGLRAQAASNPPLTLVGSRTPTTTAMTTRMLYLLTSPMIPSPTPPRVQSPLTLPLMLTTPTMG